MSDDECLRLDRQLCFPIYACSKEIIRKYTPLLEGIGLTYTQYIVMLALWEKDEISVRELGDRLLLDSGTLSPILEKLEGKGLLEREKVKGDERKVAIKLTDKGEGLRVPAREIPAKMGKCLNLSTEEAEKLGEILYKLLKNLCYNE